MKKDHQNLFDNFTFKSGVNVRNRLVMPPMTTYSADEKDDVSQEELAYYRERADGVHVIRMKKLLKKKVTQPAGSGIVKEKTEARHERYFSSVRRSGRSPTTP